MELSIPENKIKVTVLDLTPSNHFTLFKNFLLSKLPLRSLPIKIPQRPIHICQNLYLEVLSYEEIIYRKEMGNFIEEPWLNIALVDSESLSQYKGYIKPKLKDWHHTIVDKRDQDWLIVHIDCQNALRLNPINHQRSQTTNLQSQVSNGLGKKNHQTSLSTGNLQSSKFLQSSILDKLRSDFEDRTRIVNLDQLHMDPNEYPQNQQQSTISSVLPKIENSLIGLELIQKIKDRIGPMFTKLYIKYDEEIRKLDNQRLLPGWNFCTFFLIKEGMAQALHLTSFYSDSLRIYDELEALFWETYNSQTLNYFQSFGFLDLKIEEFNFLKLNAGEYRKKLGQNNLPLFQLKLYLFLNQFQLLLNSEQFLEALDRSLKFLIEMISLIEELSPRDLDSELKTCFWVYSICFVIVDKVDFMMDKMSLDPVFHRLIIMKKLSLLELAKVQLNQLGIKYQKFPNLPPYNLNEKLKKLSPLSTPPQNLSTIIPLNETLKLIHNVKDNKIIDLEALFDDFYISLNKRILALHKTLGFDQICLLDEILILNELSKKEDIDTKQLIKNLEKLEPSLLKSYKLGWNLIEHYLHQILQIYLKFNYIENFVKLSLKLIPIVNSKNSKTFLEFLEYWFLQKLKELERDLIKPIQDNFELIAITPSISSDIGFYLNLRLSNNLLNNLPITNIQLALIEFKDSGSLDESDLIWFRLRNIEGEGDGDHDEDEDGESNINNIEEYYQLKLGLNELKLTCNDFSAINYKFEKLLIDLGKLSFILDLSQPAQWLNLSIEYPLIILEPSYCKEGLRIKLTSPYLNLNQFQLKLKCLGNEVDEEESESDGGSSNGNNNIEHNIQVKSNLDNDELIQITPQRIRDWLWLNFKKFKINEILNFTLNWKQLGLLKEPNNDLISSNYLVTISDGKHWIRYKSELIVSKPTLDPFYLVENLNISVEDSNQLKLIALSLNSKFNDIRLLDIKLNLLPRNGEKVREFNNLNFSKNQVIRSNSILSQLFELNDNNYNKEYSAIDKSKSCKDDKDDKDDKESNENNDSDNYNDDDIIFLDYELKIKSIDIIKEIELLLTLKFNNWLSSQNLLIYKKQIINHWLTNFSKDLTLDYITTSKFSLKFCMEGISGLFDGLGVYIQKPQSLGELEGIISNSIELGKQEFESEFNEGFYNYWGNWQIIRLDK